MPNNSSPSLLKLHVVSILVNSHFYCGPLEFYSQTTVSYWSWKLNVFWSISDVEYGFSDQLYPDQICFMATVSGISEPRSGWDSVVASSDTRWTICRGQWFNPPHLMSCGPANSRAYDEEYGSEIHGLPQSEPALRRQSLHHGSQYG